MDTNKSARNRDTYRLVMETSKHQDVTAIHGLLRTYAMG